MSEMLLGSDTLPNKIAALVSTGTAATGGSYWAGIMPHSIGGVASLIGIVGVIISVYIAIMRYNREQAALDEDRKQRREKRAEEKIEAVLRKRLLERDLENESDRRSRK